MSELVIPPPQIEQVTPPPVITEELVALQGPPGPPGGGAYTHSQAVASALWTVNHNLNRAVSGVSLRTTGGVDFEAEWLVTSPNQLLVLLSAPFAGTAHVI